MSTQIDSLSIKIESTSRGASAAIDQLTQSLQKLKSASGFSNIEKSLKKIEEAVTKGLSKAPSQFNQSAKAADSFGKSARKAADDTQSLGSSLKSATSSMISFLANTAGIYTLGQGLAAAWSAAREWDGISSRFAEGFGDQVYEAYDHVQKLQEALYINDQAFMQYSSNFATLARGFGVAEDAIASMSIGLTELAYDIYAKNNDFYTFEEAMNAVRSAIVGEVEPIRRAGISIMESTLKETAANLGLTTSVENMTEAQKAMLRYKAMVDQAYASSTVGTYIQELNTVEGMSRAVSQQLKGLVQTIGAALIPIVAAAMPYIQAFIQLLTMAISALAALFGVQVKSVSWGSGLDALGSSAAGATDAVKDTTQALGGAGKAAKKLKDYTMGFDELNIIKPPDDSGGGGGGGGGGGLGDDWGLDLDSLWSDSMINQATNKAKELVDRFLSFIEPFKPYFDDMLDVILAIGAGFLAWKVSTSFLDSVKALSDMNKIINGFSKKAIGITLMVTGITLSALGAYDIGYEGPKWENIVKTAIGNALLVGGSLLTFGTGPLGWAIGIGASVLIDLIGIKLGADKREMEREITRLFGDISLTDQEISDLAKKHLNTDWYVDVTMHLDLLGGLDATVTDISNAMKKLNAYGWKVETGIELSEAEKQHYIETIDSFVKTAQKYVTDRGYAVSVGIQATLGDTEVSQSIQASNAAISVTLSNYLAQLGTELQGVVNASFTDGILTIDEEQAISDLMNQIAHITDVISQSQLDAEMEVINLSYSNVEMDKESWDKYVKELKKISSEMKEAAEESVTNTLASLKANVTIATELAQADPNNAELKRQLAEAEKAYNDYLAQNPLQVAMDEIDFKINNQIYTHMVELFSKELGMAEPILQQKVQDLFVNGAMVVMPDEAYDNIGNLVMQMQSSLVNGFDAMDISSSTRKLIEEQVSDAIPTLNDLKEEVAKAQEAGVAVTQSVREGLTDIYTLKAMSSDVEEQMEGITFLIGQKLSNDPSFYDMLSKADDFGWFLNKELAMGITSNLQFVEDASSGMVNVISNGIKVGVIEKTPDLVENLKNMGVTLTKSLNTGATLETPLHSFIGTIENTLTKGGASAVTAAGTLGSSMGTSLGSHMSSAATSLVNSTLSSLQSTYNSNASRLQGKPSSVTFNRVAVQMMASGGMPDEGQLFIAREAGPEMVGSMNGHTAVANNDQIVEGISAGVYSAVLAAMSQGNSNNTANVNVYLDGKQITSAVEKRQRERGATIMTGGVTFGY